MSSENEVSFEKFFSTRLLTKVPEPWRRWLYVNPMTGLTEGFRSVFLGKPLDGPAVALSVGSSLLFFIAGILWFERLERRFADVI